MYDELLTFLEADLAGANPPPAEASRLTDPIRLLDRVTQLANDDWSEQEAATEIGRLASFDCVHAAHSLVLAALVGKPYVDVLGIRIGRILRTALDEHVVPLPAQPTTVRPSGFLARLFRSNY